VHEHLGSLLDDPRHADADPEDGRAVNLAVGEYRVQPGHDLPDDHVHVMLGGADKRVLRLRALRHGQVKEFDPRPRLPDVDTDDVAVSRVHSEHRPRSPAVGVLEPGLDHDALVEQFADHIGHRGGA